MNSNINLNNNVTIQTLFIVEGYYHWRPPVTTEVQNGLEIVQKTYRSMMENDQRPLTKILLSWAKLSLNLEGRY